MTGTPRGPELFWLRQQPAGTALGDVEARTDETLAALHLGGRSAAGQSVAVAVGSRGIADLAPVVRSTVAHLRALGLDPFVVPAMGSHGGATRDGQQALLAGYGVTEAGVGCPVHAQMDTVELCTTELGFPVHFDALAAAADHVVVVNRVKPHTQFEGDVESGLAKMLLIGLGKQRGAETYHRAVFDHEWPRIASTVMPEVLTRVSVLAAVGIVENADDRTARVEAMHGTDILGREPDLLAEARKLLPRLPFDEFDIVLIDRIGKDVSGTGWDTNTLGRKRSIHEPHPDRRPHVRTVIVRGLTDATKGNALGIGLAELARSRAVEQMDPDTTRINAETCGDLPAAMIPIHRRSDLELLEASRVRTGLRDLDEARIGWIHTTLDLGVLACSRPFLDEARSRDDLVVLTDPVPLPLDDDGNLPDDVRDVPGQP